MAFNSPSSGLIEPGLSTPTGVDSSQKILNAHVIASHVLAQDGSQSAQDAQPTPAPRPARFASAPAAPSDQAPSDSGPPSRLDFSKDSGSLEEQGLQQQYSGVQEQRDAEMRGYQTLQAASRTYSQLSNINKDSYTAQRMQEMQPTADIDAAILKVRQRALLEQSSLWENGQMAGLNWHDALDVINNRKDMYAKQIEELSTMRQARLDITKSKIDEEYGHIQEQVGTAKFAVDTAQKALEYGKSIGASDKELGVLIEQSGKTAKALAKANKNSGGVTDRKSLALYALTKAWEDQNGTTSMPSATKMGIEIQANRLAKSNDKTMQDLEAANGDYTKLNGPPTEYSTPQWRRFKWQKPDVSTNPITDLSMSQ